MTKHYVKRLDFYKLEDGIEVIVEYSVKNGTGRTRFKMTSEDDPIPICEKPYYIKGEIDFHSHIKGPRSRIIDEVIREVEYKQK